MCGISGQPTPRIKKIGLRLFEIRRIPTGLAERRKVLHFGSCCVAVELCAASANAGKEEKKSGVAAAMSAMTSAVRNMADSFKGEDEEEGALIRCVCVC